jgi:hypothetical protein
MSQTTWIESPESSNIARFRFDDATRVLYVEFHDGSIYRYFDVPLSVFECMRTAPSKGQFLAVSVKGIYRYARV